MKFSQELRGNIRGVKDLVKSIAHNNLASVKCRTNAYYNVRSGYIRFRMTAYAYGKIFSVDFAMSLAELEQLNSLSTIVIEKFSTLAKSLRGEIERERLVHKRLDMLRDSFVPKRGRP